MKHRPQLVFSAFKYSSWTIVLKSMISVTRDRFPRGTARLSWPSSQPRYLLAPQLFIDGINHRRAPSNFPTRVGWTKKCAQFWFPKEFLKLTSVRNCSHQSALLDKLFQNANIDFFLFHWKMYFFPGFSGFALYVCCGTLSYFHEGTFSRFPQVGLGEEADSSEIVLGPFWRDYYCKMWLQFNMFDLIQFNLIWFILTTLLLINFFTFFSGKHSLNKQFTSLAAEDLMDVQI